MQGVVVWYIAACLHPNGHAMIQWMRDLACDIPEVNGSTKIPAITQSLMHAIQALMLVSKNRKLIMTNQ